MGDKRLVAYVAGDDPPDGNDLREYVKAGLPDYMVPAFVTVLPALPLTANGKLDRAALPAPEAVVWSWGEGAATPTEDLLAGLWCAVLGLDWVGREGDFFALGGHSLLATQLIARIHSVFGISLPLDTVFVNGSLRELAAEIDSARHQELGEPPIVS